MKKIILSVIIIFSLLINGLVIYLNIRQNRINEQHQLELDVWYNKQTIRTTNRVINNNTVIKGSQNNAAGDLIIDNTKIKK